jgi:hypothetical protein
MRIDSLDARASADEPGLVEVGLFDGEDCVQCLLLPPQEALRLVAGVAEAVSQALEAAQRQLAEAHSTSADLSIETPTGTSGRE